MAADLINHPPHYCTGKIEVIDYIEDQKLGYHLGNAVKYISRCQHKGTLTQDIDKAIWYLKRYKENQIDSAVRVYRDFSGGTPATEKESKTGDGIITAEIKRKEYAASKGDRV